MNPSRETVPLIADDISTFCKQLRRQLVDAGHGAPGHLALLNMLARSAGHRNFQMLRARPGALPEAAEPPVQARSIELPREVEASPAMRKLLACFDDKGRLLRMPHKYAAQQMAIWALWSRFPARRELNERQVNETLDAFHTFGDPVTLRRELVNAKLLWRTIDGRVYKKLAQRPDAATRAFLDLLFAHSRSG